VGALHVADTRHPPQAAYQACKVPHIFGFQNKFDHRF
jgi:hypothetical protein